MFSPKQKPVHENTQHSQETDIHTPGGIQTHDPSKRAAANPHLRPRGHWDRQLYFLPMVIHKFDLVY
jgi:hypothetical protein